MKPVGYIDFVDLKYIPAASDLICKFYVEPQGLSLEEAAGGVAAESSVGTWTELGTMREYAWKLHATVFEIKGNHVTIAYPAELFEKSNMPNILSSIAGNVFGLAALKNLRLVDIQIPRELVKSFKGPRYGIEGIRRILKVPKRPLVGTIIKPKLGLNPGDHAEVAYEAWSGGCDIVKDDENLASQRFNRFATRLRETLRRRDRAEKETGERKMYLVNITAETEEMLRRAQLVKDSGGEYVMIDILTCGFASVQTLRDMNLGLVLHGHRAGHAAFTRNPKHGISMRVISRIGRIIGLDQLHVGAAVGKMSEERDEVLENVQALKGELYGLKRVLPVASGGLHPRLVPSLVEIFGNDVVIQAGGGIHGHKDGTYAGARAMRQAIDATVEGITLAEYANSHGELRAALNTWPA
ncbi:MAG: type III ribulose-bisphosphate carboxylase [Candidatus Bathyarchaeia archaeon]